MTDLPCPRKTSGNERSHDQERVASKEIRKCKSNQMKWDSYFASEGLADADLDCLDIIGAVRVAGLRPDYGKDSGWILAFFWLINQL